MTIIALIFIALVVVAASYFTVAAVFAVICWAFGLAFSWKIVWGIYGALLLLKWVISAASGK